MAYVDTNVIISYYYIEDDNHDLAVKVVRRLKNENIKIYVSSLTILEVFSVISRKLPESKIPPHLRYADERTRILMMVQQALSLINPIIINDEPRTELFGENIFFHKFTKAVELAHQLKLKTLDLLHIAYAIQLAEKGLVNMFVTFDGEIMEKRSLLEKLGIKVYHLEEKDLR